jgi:type IV pilus assembly protein PilP
MKSSRIIFSLIVLLASQLILLSCGGDKPDEPPPTIKKTAIPSVPAAKKDEQKATDEAVTDYSLTQDMRNPFRTYIVIKPLKPVDDGHIKTPLECCDINLFKVSVVISGIENPRALVLAPDGKRYAVKIGDRIGVKEGKIVEIEGKSIIVEG